jgi:hypothetical protein
VKEGGGERSSSGSDSGPHVALLAVHAEQFEELFEMAVCAPVEHLGIKKHKTVRGWAGEVNRAHVCAGRTT